MWSGTWIEAGSASISWSTNRPATYDSELQRLGCQIIPCEWPQSRWSYGRRFRRAINQHGPYDVVHSHVHYFSGWTLSMARAVGIRTRIAHSHTTGVRMNSFSRRTYQWLMRRAIWNRPLTELVFR